MFANVDSQLWSTMATRAYILSCESHTHIRFVSHSQLKPLRISLNNTYLIIGIANFLFFFFYICLSSSILCCRRMLCNLLDAHSVRTERNVSEVEIRPRQPPTVNSFEKYTITFIAHIFYYYQHSPTVPCERVRSNGENQFKWWPIKSDDICHQWCVHFTQIITTHRQEKMTVSFFLFF